MDWEKIKDRLDRLLESGRHGELRGALMMLNEVDIAEFLEQLDPEKMLMVFRILPKDVSSDVFSYMDSDQRQHLIESISDAEVAQLVDEMFIDDAVDFLEELPAGVVKRVLQNTDEKRRNLINQFLRYPENSAGSIMTIEYCESRAGQTVRESIEEIRRTGIDKETVYTLYVIDERRQLEGTVALRKLIMADGEMPIERLMDTNVISVTTTDDQETVADTVRKYDLMSIPVVDKENRLVGIVTVDDIIDVIEEENTEDFEKMGALMPSEDEYMKSSVFVLFRNRIFWLLFLMISGTFTGLIIGRYSALLTTTGTIGAMLMTCVPMLMNTGGNSGSQSSTLVIRGLALGEIEFKDMFTVLWKEIRVAALAGASLMVINYARLILVSWFSNDFAVQWQYNTVWVVMSISIFFTVVMAKSIGCILPLLARKVRLDPALMASPLITTIVDACSLFVLFSFAMVLLNVTVGPVI